MPDTHKHTYNTRIEWTGNRGTGTGGYRDYDRSYDLSGAGKPTIAGTADTAFYGDAAKWNPEEMLLAALSSCHMLAYLHLCADAGVVVLEYKDNATASMQLDRDGAGRFTDALLCPRVTIAPESDAAHADALHTRAHELCFIANSVNFPVRCEAQTMHASLQPASLAL